MEMPQNIKALLDRIVHTLAREYRPHQIILYGSQAYGVPGQISDIDLLIVKDSQASPYQRAVHVRRLLRDPQRRIPVDLLVVTPAELEERLKRGDQFLQTIISHGEVLYAA
ncbi:MAG: nucleotidyltransferase domain-containing protein [Anaerolineae bacterium]